VRFLGVWEVLGIIEYTFGYFIIDNGQFFLGKSYIGFGGSFAFESFGTTLSTIGDTV